MTWIWARRGTGAARSTPGLGLPVRRGLPHGPQQGIIRREARPVGAGLVLACANTEAMRPHRQDISQHVTPTAHAVLVLDGAGWHGLAPRNLTLPSLPPDRPELNPVENVRD